MQETYEIGDEVFYANMAEYAMTDKTMKLEARINKVKVQGKFDFLEEPTKYLFMIGEAKLQAEAKQLFDTESLAREYINNEIKKIPVIVTNGEETINIED